MSDGVGPLVEDCWRALRRRDKPVDDRLSPSLPLQTLPPTHFKGQALDFSPQAQVRWALRYLQDRYGPTRWMSQPWSQVWRRALVIGGLRQMGDLVDLIEWEWPRCPSG